MSSSRRNQLPLLCVTPDGWARHALSDPLALLNDHAHLEKKAASNALELLNRWPEPSPPENWVKAMSAIARDEVEHLGQVVRLLARKGGRLTKTHRNDYAADLRQKVRIGQGVRELVDRLMVSALIEARSCERFDLLASHCNDAKMSKLFGGLFASEQGHYEVFIGLARQLPDAADIDRRWQFWLSAESRIIRKQKPGPRIHSWMA